MADLYLNRLHSTQTAVVTESGESFTYADLSGFAADLYSRIDHRCLVFCLCRNSIESLIGYVSFLGIRVFPLMLDASLEKSMLKNLINIYKPEYISLPRDKQTDFEDKEEIFFFRHYALIRLNHKGTTLLNDDLALLLTTYGSTGSPLWSTTISTKPWRIQGYGSIYRMQF